MSSRTDRTKTFGQILDEITKTFGPRKPSFMHPDANTELAGCIIELMANHIIRGYDKRQPTRTEMQAVRTLLNAFTHIFDHPAVMS